MGRKMKVKNVRLSSRRSYLEPCPEKVEKPTSIESHVMVPKKNEWIENPDLAFGIRIRVNLAIPAVWPM